jgi:hypothetical protein
LDAQSRRSDLERRLVHAAVVERLPDERDQSRVGEAAAVDFGDRERDPRSQACAEVLPREAELEAEVKAELLTRLRLSSASQPRAVILRVIGGETGGELIATWYCSCTVWRVTPKCTPIASNVRPLVRSSMIWRWRS